MRGVAVVEAAATGDDLAIKGGLAAHVTIVDITCIDGDDAEKA